MAKKKLTEAQFNKEIERVHSRLGMRLKSRVQKRTAMHFLKQDGPLFWNGRAFRVKSKHVGCGIYELTSEDWE